MVERDLHLGPNIKRLISHKMSVDAVPKGGGLESALNFLTTPGAIGKGWKEASEWVRQSIILVRQAVEPKTRGKRLRTKKLLDI